MPSFSVSKMTINSLISITIVATAIVVTSVGAIAQTSRAQAAVAANYTKGMEQYRAGEFEAALKSFNKAIAVNTKRADYYAARGRTNIALRRLTSALADLDRSLLRGGPHDDYASRANIHIERGDADKAAADLNKALQIAKELKDPTLIAVYHVTLAGVYEAKAKGEESRANLAAAVKAVGDFSSTVDLFAEEDIATKHYGMAWAKYTAMIAHKTEATEYLSYRASVLIVMGRNDDALADYDMALTFNPKSALYHINRADLLRSMKRYQEALTAAMKGIDFLTGDDPILQRAFEVKAAINCNLGQKRMAALDEAEVIRLGGEIKTPCR